MSLDRQPPRGMLVNLETNERFNFPFNPTTIEETLEARHERIDVPGLSHQRLQYQNTTNKVIPLELYMSQMGVDLQQPNPSSFRASPHRPFVGTTMKRYLESLLFPVGELDAQYRGTPRVLFVWPRTISLVGKVMRVNFLHRAFSTRTGATTILVARLTIEEELETRLMMDDVRRYGAEHVRGGIPGEEDEVEEAGG